MVMEQLRMMKRPAQDDEAAMMHVQRRCVRHEWQVTLVS